jgi:hypothetical protein
MLDKSGRKRPDFPRSIVLRRSLKHSLEASVERLAGALDALESRLEARIGEFGAKTEAIEAARLKAHVAKTQAAAAAEDLADAIRDLRSLIDETEGS